MTISSQNLITKLTHVNIIIPYMYVDFTAQARTVIAIAVRIITRITAHHEASDQQSHAQSEEDVQNGHGKGVFSIVLGLGIVLVAFCV